MNLSHMSVKRPVTTIMLLLVVVLVGLVSIVGIPMDLFPKIEAPVALVMVNYPNASPEEVETMITKPVEQQLATVEDLDQLFSMSMAGSSITMVQFQMSTDMNFATLNMREKIALIQDYLPDNASDPIVMKMDMNATPILHIYVSGDMPLADLYEKVNGNISNTIERASGVASIVVSGGVENEVAVTLQQERLAGYGLTLSQISQMLAAENVNRPSGDIEKGSTKVIVRTIGEFDSVESIAQYPITLPTREVVRLQDIATIEERYQEQDSISRIDGNSSIGVSITKQSTANTVDVSKSVLKALDKLEKQYPELSFTVGFNQANFITSAVSSVASSAIAGGLLAVLVIFLFLKNLGSTMIIAISIPASFLATFVLMKSMGMSLNMMTLCGLTLGVGMLVDNSVIVLENIYRVNQECPDPSKAAVLGSKQVYLAVISSTLTSVVVYLPIAVSDGISALMFRDFCFTIIFALMASLVVSLTVIPMLCSKILRRDVHTDYMRIGTRRYKFKLVPYFTRFIDRLTSSYEAAIHSVLHRRKKTILTGICIFVVSITLISLVGMELIPATDEGSFTVTVDSPYGTSLKDRDTLVSSMEEQLLALPELKHLTVDIASQNMMGGSSNTSTLSATLVDKSQRSKSTAQLVKEVKQMFKNVTGADISINESSMVSSMVGGAAISLILRGDDLAVLEQIGDDLSAQFSQIKGISEASTDVTEGNPEIRVTLNRSVAANYGITAHQLATSLESALSGNTATKLKMNGNEIEINLALADTYQKTADNMKQVLIPSSTGQMVPVGELANFEFDNSPSVINRENQQRTITLSCSIDGRDLGSVSKDILKTADQYPFPDGYTYDTGGQQDQMTEAFGSLGLALVTAILLVYMLLAAQFESMVLPLIVMIAVPFAMSGALLALFFTGMRLSMPAFIGLIMLIGIVVNNSILLVEFIKLNEESMGRDEAIVEAGKSRLRPILMTTITTVVGMIPLSLGLGDGGEILAPMGVSIIGGLIGSTIVALLFVPVLYAINDDRKNKNKQKKQAKEEMIRELEAKWASQEV